MCVHINLDYFTLSYDPQLKLCVIDWQNVFVPKGKLPFYGEKILAFIQAHQAENLISDLSKAKLLSLDDQKYNNEVLLPQVIELGLENIMVITPQNVFAQYNAEKMMESGQAQKTSNPIQVFDDFNKAKEYLEKEEVLVD